MSRARRTLSSGATRPNTCSCGRRSITSSSDSCWRSVPVMSPGPSSSWSAIARAVTVWSPVIMRTSMPASSASRTACLRLGPQRVDDADQRDQHQIGDRRHRVGARGRHRRVVEVTDGEGQDPQPLLRHLLVRGEELVAHVGDRNLLAVPEHVAATVDDDVGRALDRHEVRRRAGRRRVIQSGRSWNVAMNLYSESNGTSASRGSDGAGLLGTRHPSSPRARRTPLRSDHR